MHSDRIKLIVNKANMIIDIVNSKGVEFARDDADELLDLMIKFARKSPTFAVAVLGHLEDQGFDILDHDSEKVFVFKEKFAKSLGMDRRSLIVVKKIAARLFR